MPQVVSLYVEIYLVNFKAVSCSRILRDEKNISCGTISE